MSDIFASSSEKDITDTTMLSTTPYSSEGPTLPILGASDEQAHIISNTRPGDKSTKRKRSIDNDDNGDDANLGGDGGEVNTRQHTLHTSLYTPWALLPAALRNTVQQADVTPVIFSKNQNVRAGVNRVKRLLGYVEHQPGGDNLEATDVIENGSSDIIAISAQGDGTVKLVGIVELARRVVGARSGAGGGTSEEIVQWWMYTVLSSVEVGRKTGEGKGEGGAQTKKVPVLTVWMTRRRLTAWKKVLGEQMFVVREMGREDD